MKAGWEVKTLGSTISLEYGKPLEPRHRKVDGLYPVYGANGTIARTNKFYHNRPSIIVGRKGSAGEINLTVEKFWPLDVTYFVTFDESKNDLKFIYYLLSKLNLPSMAKGVKPGINRNDVYSLGVNIPSISEQQRIVAILDQAFEGIAKARANAEQNLQNARALFESHLQSVFTQHGDGWEKKTLADLSKNKNAVVSGPFGSNLKVSDYRNEGVPILRLQNIGKGYFIDKSIKFITEEKANELSYHSFESGDIALAKLGIPIGKTCIIPAHFKSGIITADIVRIRPDKNVANFKFLEYFLNTDLAVSQLTKNISGATRPRVNLSDVRDIELNLPPLNLQEKIVTEIDLLAKETQRLEALYQRKIACLDELKKSLLQQAFAGEL